MILLSLLLQIIMKFFFLLHFTKLINYKNEYLLKQQAGEVPNAD